METVEIRQYRGYEEPEILALYRSVGWSAYYRQPETLRKAFAGSLCVFAAYDGRELVGLLRVVGDGETVVFVQDLLVHPKHQRRGIGTMLVERLLARFRHVRQIHLLTDDCPDTVDFYRAVGFTAVEDTHCRAFTRLK